MTKNRKEGEHKRKSYIFMRIYMACDIYFILFERQSDISSTDVI